MKNLALSLLFLGFIAFIAGCGKTETNTKTGEKINTETSKQKIAGSKELKVNSSASEVLWHGEKVVGKHDGDVKIKQGVLNVKDGKIVGGEVEIDLNTITNKDLTDAGFNAKLVNHLKSEDFFDVAKFPIAKLELSEVTPIQNAASGQPNYTVKGNLTIRGTTKGISFPALLNVTDSKVTGEATFDIDRTEFGLKYGSGKFFEGLGDKMIKDTFTLKVKVDAGS
ncbi:MAG: YceI family protein [Ignavibacteria bacterium]|nr:YceI family protein [Ignavibacteria bacterium]